MTDKELTELLREYDHRIRALEFNDLNKEELRNLRKFMKHSPEFIHYRLPEPKGTFPNRID